MDATTTGISPSSMETIAAGMAGFALASLFSFARKPPQVVVVKEESRPTNYNATPGTSNIRFPGMGHDFHVLARLVAEKQRQLVAMAPRTGGGSDESISSQILKNFRPQLAEFSSFEWRASSPVVQQSSPYDVSETIGRITHMTFGPSSRQSPSLESTKLPVLTPLWDQNKANHLDAVAARDHEGNNTRSYENTAEEFSTDQRNQRTRRRCCRRSNDAGRRGWGWCRGRDDETKPRDCDDNDGRGWPRYRQEGHC